MNDKPSPDATLAIHQITVGGFDDNFSYLIVNTKASVAAVVDPAGDVSKITDAMATQKLSLEAIFITHTHFDHIEGIDALLDQAGTVPIYVHERGVSAVTTPGREVRRFETMVTVGLPARGAQAGGAPVVVLETPGHNPDAVCLFIAAAQSATSAPQLITGDTLFVEGCGRTNSDHVSELYESLQKLKTLPEETRVYPGHDYGPTPTSTIGEEKAKNRFFLAENLSEFTMKRLG